MKSIYLIGVGIFWTALIILGVAGLVSYEQGKRYDAQGTTPQTVDTQAVVDAVAQGATVWNEELVAQHSTTDDCWIIVNGGVYDVTEYVPFHPGGEQAILTYCGKEATQAFATKGGTGGDHSKQAYALLEQYRLAALGDALPVSGADTATTTAPAAVEPPVTTTNPPAAPSPKPAPAPAAPSPAPTQTTYTTTLVAQHSSVSDCWLIINNKIYDVTDYIPFHPGGTNTIRPWCGKESTQAFTTRGGNGRHSQSAWSQLDRYYIATLGTTAPATTGTTGTTPATGAVSPTSAAATSYETAIQEEYPEAVITDINVEDDGRAEVKFIYEGDECEAKLDASYNILESQCN
jgi:cytochrome b involved in lipid metabolism